MKRTIGKNLSLNLLCLFCLILFRPRAVAPAEKPVAERPQTITITDDRPKKITIKFPPRRIVSLSPVTTEYLYSAGMGDRVVGVTSFCKYPPQVTNKPKVGGVTNPSLEAIVALKPDLVVASKLNPLEVLDRIEQLKIPVYGTNPNQIEDVLKAIEELGRIGGTEKQARETTKPLRDRVTFVRNRLSGIKQSHRPRVFYVLDCDPVYTAGKGSIVDEIIRLAGGENVAHDLPQPWGTFSMETLLARDPDVLIFSGSEAVAALEKASHEESRWHLLSAARKNRVIAFSTDFIGSPTPRAVEGMWKLARYLHPEVFRARLKEKPDTGG